MENVKYRRMSCSGTEEVDCEILEKINKTYKIKFVDPSTKEVVIKEVQPFDLTFPKFADYMVY